MKYHYIILQDKADFFRVSWNDIHKISDTEYYDYFPCGANTLVKKIFQIHFSQKIRKQINLPFKSFWNRFFYTKKVMNSTNRTAIFLEAMTMTTKKEKKTEKLWKKVKKNLRKMRHIFG